MRRLQLRVTGNIKVNDTPSQRHVQIVVVSHSRTMDFEVDQSIFAACSSLIASGVRVSRGLHVGDADLAGARNLVLAGFMASPCTDLMLIDNDVSCEPGSIERLLSHPVDLVAGAYPKRVEGGGYPVRTLPGVRTFVDTVTGEHSPTGLLRVGGAPTGFMRLTRACVEKMIAAYPDSWYDDERAPNGRAWNLFEFAVRDRKRWTEDLYFCQRWIEIGGTVWVDPHMVLHHHGTKTYSGRFADFIANVAKAEAGAQ